MNFYYLKRVLKNIIWLSQIHAFVDLNFFAALSNNAFKYFVWESFKKRLDALRYSLMIILIDTLGLYKISYVADFKITWNILSNLNKLKLSFFLNF